MRGGRTTGVRGVPDLGVPEGRAEPIRSAARRLLHAALMNVLLASAAYASTLYVPADHASIQAAINAATHGDTIIVAAGTYFEHIDFGGKAIEVLGESGPDQTIVDGSGSGTVVRFASGETPSSRLSGFTIRNGRGVQEGAGIYVFGSAPTITGNWITGNQGCEGSGIYVRFASPIIRGNTITDNHRTTCFGGGGGGGISLSGAGGAQVLDNDISYNVVLSGAAGGIEVFGAGAAIIRGNVLRGNSTGGEGGAMWIVGPSTPLVANNLIVGNSAVQAGGGISIAMFSGTDRPILANNTFVENVSVDGSALFVNGFDDDAVIANNVIIGIDDREAVSCGTRYQPTAPVFRFNDVYNPWGPLYGGTCGDLTGVASNVSVDPLFVDAAGGDYHLHSESPLVDAGSNAVVQLLETDFDGDSRILDGDGVGEAVVDMGFDEVARGIMSFATLTSKTRITRRGVGRDRIVIRGTFTVAASSSGIALQIEQLQLVLEDGSATVFRYEPPPASFVRLGSGERYGSTTSNGQCRRLYHHRRREIARRVQVPNPRARSTTQFGPQ